VICGPTVSRERLGSDVESEQDDVAVLHEVVASFDA
jgi:hypothetical protein